MGKGGNGAVYRLDDEKIVKCIEVTASLVHAAIESGKFEAKDGETVSEYFDKVFGEVSECMKLTSPDFIDRYGRSKRH